MVEEKAVVDFVEDFGEGGDDGILFVGGEVVEVGDVVEGRVGVVDGCWEADVDFLGGGFLVVLEFAEIGVGVVVFAGA